MDDALFNLALFLIATFGAALVAGLAGFAFGIVAAGIWLHVITPVETASLIVGFGLIVQGLAVWKLRNALDWRKLWAFVAGGALGVPLGVAVLGWTNPAHVRAGTGAVLVLYALYALARPKMQPVAGGPLRDAGVGFLNGILAGITGFAGIVVTIWCGLRGWPKDVQRAVFQPVGVATFIMCAAWLGGTGAISAHTVELFLLGLPFLLAGTWLGLKLYGRLDEEGFRKIVLALLLVSGVALLWSLR
ncbi:MAG TPA: sulfite exporter TauE/SafE family protein [Xanthobacteraceae bacterium]|nr:sulfite exporter TauE/SafE family protein [Xanthobacteraceae bacterium]